MFNTDFLAGALVLVLVFAAAFGLAALTGLDPTLVVVGLAAGVWGLFHLLERRLAARLGPEEDPIRVDWEDKLTDTDFAADGEVTALCLKGRGLTPETALGQMLIFATEHESSNGEIWFEGQFIREGDRIIVRATDPV